MFTRIINSDATIISLDLPNASFGGGYPNSKLEFFKGFAKKNQRIFLLRVDSHLESSVSQVRSILKGNQLDFLFIDGDHTWGVKKDFAMFRPLVKKGRLIVFYDICKGVVETCGNVSEFWNEIKNCIHIWR